MMKGMKVVKHVNNTTQQQEQPLYFHRAFSFFHCHGLSRNLLLDFTNLCQFKRFLIDYNLISPEQKSYQLKAHL